MSEQDAAAQSPRADDQDYLSPAADAAPQAEAEPVPEPEMAPEPERERTAPPAPDTTVTTRPISRPISRVVPQEFRHAPDPMLRAERVSATFGRRRALHDVDLEVLPGQVCCLVGPAGSGKTAFLRCVAHLDPINGGRLWVDGRLLGYRQAGNRLHELRPRRVAAQRRQVGFVADPPSLFSGRTVLANAAAGGTLTGHVSRRAARSRATEVLERFGVEQLADRQPAALTPAEQVRVALARALSTQPKVLLVDEPTARLSTDEATGLLRELAADGLAVVVATRAADFARRVGDVAAVFDDGRVVRFGAVDEVLAAAAMAG